MSLASQIRALHEGRLTFSGFASATAKHWRRLATYLHRRWHASPACSEEDTTQELLLGVWRSLPKFDPTRGVSLDHFVVWNAIDQAKKRLHAARDAVTQRDTTPSLILVPLLDSDHESSSDSTPHECVERAQIGERFIASATSQRERCIAKAFLRTLDFEGTALALYADPTTRRECSFFSPDHALIVVRRTAHKLAERVQSD